MADMYTVDYINELNYHLPWFIRNYCGNVFIHVTTLRGPKLDFQLDLHPAGWRVITLRHGVEPITDLIFQEPEEVLQHIKDMVQTWLLQEKLYAKLCKVTIAPIHFTRDKPPVHAIVTQPRRTRAYRRITSTD